MQYILDVVPLPSVALLSVAVALLIAASCLAARRTDRGRPQVRPYATWDAFVRDVLDPEIPIDHILERCGGRLPAKPVALCVACGATASDVRHSRAHGTWSHCDACAAGCPSCQETEIRRRIDAEHQRMRVGSAPCSFCQQLLGGGR